jgi:diaminopropionate ammonia-lyase
MTEPRPIDFHRHLPAYRATRLVELPDPPAAVTRAIMKLEVDRFGLPSFKVLGASWAVAHRVAGWLGDSAPVADLAELRGALDRRGMRPTIVAATDGNHGRAVAWSARQLGCPADIHVPAGTARSRLDGIAGEGARVHIVDGDYDATVAAASDLAAAEADRLLVQDTTVPGHEAGVEAVVDGYTTIFDELEGQLPGDAPDPLILVVPVGVGSLAVAAARFLERRGRPGLLVTVEPSEAASLKRSLEVGRLVSLPGPHVSCMVGLRCGSISTDAWPVLSDATDLAVSVEDHEADDAMRWLATRDIVVGECGAAPLAALRRAAADGTLAALTGGSGTAVLIATEAPTDPERWRAVVGAVRP